MSLLFKSREEREIERNIEIKKGLNSIRKNLKELGKSQQEYIQKAHRAKEIGAKEQFLFLRQILKRTIGQKKILERQLLAIETALQIKNQAESQAQFVRSLSALSNAINIAFGNTDFATNQEDFAKALSKAESMEKHMEIFLDTTQSMMGQDTSEISEQELDNMLKIPLHDKADEDIDQDISRGLQEIEKVLGDSQSV